MISWIRSPHPQGNRFVFLDRDGVINLDREDYIKRWDELVFFPDTLEAFRLLRERRVDTIIISNQSGLHRGYISWENFWDIHHRMIRAIRQGGGDLLAAFYCPHHPDEGCSCRKPAPDMILNASRLFSIQREKSCMIGDRSTDIMAAMRAGVRGVLLDRFHHTESSKRCSSLLEVVKDLFEPVFSF